MEINILNVPVFKAVVDVFAQSLEDERISAEVRKEYHSRYSAMIEEAEHAWRMGVDLAKEEKDFDREFCEVSGRIKEQRQQMESHKDRICSPYHGGWVRK